MDRNAMCRVCLEPNPVAKWSLFECTIVGQSIADVLTLVGGVEVRVDDNLPTVCCSGCLKDVEVAHKLRERCQESHRRLAQIINSVPQIVLKHEPQEVETFKDEPLDIEPDEQTVMGDSGCFTIVEHPTEPEAMNEQPPTAVPPESSILTKLKVDNMEITIALPQLNELAQENGLSQPPSVVIEPDDPLRLAHECCGCARTFKTAQELDVHIQRVHAPRRVPPHLRRAGFKECYRCFRMVKRMKEHHVKNERCKICSRIFPSTRAASNHYRLKHSSETSGAPFEYRKKICCGCAAHFETLGDLKIHSNQVHWCQNRTDIELDRPFQCEICYANYPDYAALHQHQTRFQKDNKHHRCAHCERTFFFLRSLRDHEKTHARWKS